MIRILFLINILFFQLTIIGQPSPKVVATASMIADMAQNIAGDVLKVDCIVPIGGDPHIYEPTPGDARLVADAQLIFKNGLTFEGWLNELIDNSGTKAEVIQVTQGVDVIASEQYVNSTDPHAWMDLKNGLIYIENIKNALIKLLPVEKESFEKNYEAYRQQIVVLDNNIMQNIQSIPKNRRILITSHDAFQYYGRRYGIELESILGTSTDAEAQTSDIIRLNKIIKKRQVPAVFIESTINPKILQQLAHDNKIEIGGELYADSLGDKESEAPTYLDMLKYNTTVIVNALKKEALGIPSDSASKEGNSSDYWLYAALGILFIGGFLLVFKKLNN